jgi:hypothetical protein
MLLMQRNPVGRWEFHTAWLFRALGLEGEVGVLRQISMFHFPTLLARLRGLLGVTPRSVLAATEPPPMTAGLTVGALANTVLPYPTRGEVLKRLGDAWSRRRLTPRTKGFLTRLLTWRR